MDMVNEITIDKRDEGTYFGPLASRYAYKPELRRRVTECLEAAIRSDNRYFVLDGVTVRAAQSTRSGAMNYMADDFVLLHVQVAR